MFAMEQLHTKPPEGSVMFAQTVATPELSVTVAETVTLPKTSCGSGLAVRFDRRGAVASRVAFMTTSTEGGSPDGRPRGSIVMVL